MKKQTTRFFKILMLLLKILIILLVIASVLFLVFLLLGFLAITGLFPYFRPLFIIVFGWYEGIIHYAQGLAVGVAAFGLFLYFLHRTIRAFQSDWSIRRSLGLAGILLAFSISAIVLICAVHNAYWLKKAGYWFIEESGNRLVRDRVYIDDSKVSELAIEVYRYRKKKRLFSSWRNRSKGRRS